MRITIKSKHALLKRTVAAIFLAAAGAWDPCETFEPLPQTPESPKEREIDGNYSCRLRSSSGSSFMESHAPSSSTVSVDKETNGLILKKHSTGKTIRLKEKSENIFESRMQIPLGYAKVNVTFDGHSNFTLNETVSMANPFGSSNSNLSYDYSCKPIEDNKPNKKDDKLIKAVFIRPCEGDLYQENGFATRKTTVGGGTINSVCRDLKASGVTDVFLPFKVDDEVNSHCGGHGELLYNSKTFNLSRNERIQTANDIFKFDPIGVLVDNRSCQGIKFHAWFPVFYDPRAVALGGGKEAAGKKGVVGTGLLDGIINRVKAFLKRGSYYHSSTFADPSNQKVVEYELALLDEIIRKYPKLVGINLDYIRYAGTSEMDTEYRKDPVNKGTVNEVLVNSEAVTSFVRKVRQRFPRLILSADVKAGGGARKVLGQDDMLPLLDVIMPMVYTDQDFGGSIYIKKYIHEMQGSYPNISIVADLRGWRIGNNDKLIEDLRADIAAARDVKTNGYAIFTYEALLSQNDESKELKKIKEKIRY